MRANWRVLRRNREYYWISFVDCENLTVDFMWLGSKGFSQRSVYLTIQFLSIKWRTEQKDSVWMLYVHFGSGSILIENIAVGVVR